MRSKALWLSEKLSSLAEKALSLWSTCNYYPPASVKVNAKCPFHLNSGCWFLITPLQFYYGLISGAVGRYLNRVRTGISGNPLDKVLHSFIKSRVFPGYSRVIATFPSGQQVGQLPTFWKLWPLYRHDKMLCDICIMQEPPNWSKPNTNLAQNPSLTVSKKKKKKWKKCKERGQPNVLLWGDSFSH